MGLTRSKAKVFALGLAGWSIPCVAFAVCVPTGNVTNAKSVPAFNDELAYAPAMGETAGASAGGWLVQVGDYADRSLAQARLKVFATLIAGYDLDDTVLVAPQVDRDGRTLYRVQFIALTESTARSLCNSLGAVGGSCFISHTNVLSSDRFSATVVPSTLLTTQEKAPQSSSTNGILALASARPIGDNELENARGGFSVNGINFNFGAAVQTLVNGQLALQTNLQWTPTGPVVTQLQGLGTQIQTQVASTLASAGINIPITNTSAAATVSTSPVIQPASTIASTVGATPASNTNQANSVPTTTISAPASTTTVPVSFINISPATSSSAPSSSLLSSTVTGVQEASGTSPATSGAQSLVANSLVNATATVPSNAGNGSPTTAPNTPAQGSNPPAPSNSLASTSSNGPAVLSGVQIQSPTGSTVVFTNVANGQIQNVILNSASNQNIVQNTNMTLTIYNFASWQQTLAQHALSAQLANQVQAASGFIGGR
jgi:hypothetical protein